MNELQKLYDLLSREGYYTKSFEEFQQQYNGDASYRDKVYGVVSRDGFYTKTKEEFLTKYATAQPEVKKKEDGQFDFGSQEGSTDATATQGAPDGSLASEQSQTEDPLAGTILSDEAVSTDTFDKSMAGITPELIEDQEEYTVPKLNYNFNQYGFTFEEAGMGDAMTVTAANGKTLSVDLDPWFGVGSKESAENLKAFIQANKSESEAINARSRYRFEKTQAIQEEEDITSAVKLFNDLTEQYQQDVESWAERSRELQGVYQAQYANLTPQQIAQDPTLKEGYADFVRRNKELQSEYGSLVEKEKFFKEKGQRLDELAGKYSEMRSQQGTWSGGIWNSILTGVSSYATTLAQVGTDIMTAVLPYAGSDARGYKKEFIKVAKEKGYELPEGYEEMHIDQLVEYFNEDEYDDIDSKVTDNFRKGVKFGERQYRNPYSFVAAHTDTDMGMVDATRAGMVELWGDKSTTQQWREMQQQGFWGGAILGLAESLPAMLGSVSSPVGWIQRTAQMYAQVSDHVNREMENDAAFDDITETEKYAVTAPIGVAVGALESVGFRNVINQRGFVNKIVARALRKSTETTTAKTFAQFIRDDINSLMGRGLLTMTAGGLAEFETGAAQEIAEVGVKDIYNQVKGKDMFKTPETWTEYVGQVLRAGAQEAVGGFIMSTPSAVINAVSKGKTSLLPEGVFEAFQDMSKDPEYKTMYIAKLKQRVQAGEITLQEAKNEEEQLNKLLGIMPQIPTDLDTESQQRALELVYEKQNLESEIEGKDPNLVKKKIDRVAAINEEMQTLIEKSAQEQAEQQDLEAQIPEATEEVTVPVNEKGQVDDKNVIGEGSFTHKTTRIAAIEGWANSGQVVGQAEDLNEFSDTVGATLAERVGGGQNRQSPNFQQGKLYGKGTSDVKGGFVIVSKTDAVTNDDVVPNRGFTNQSTLEESGGVAVLKPNKRSIDNFDIYSVNNDGSLTKRSWNEFKSKPQEGVSSKTQTEQATQEEIADIESFFGEETESTTRPVSDNLSINRKGEFNYQGKAKAVRDGVVRVAKSAAQSISKILPDTKIILHESNEEYLRYVGRDGKGEYIPSDNVIHINLSKATRSTVPHEIFHAVFINKVKTDEKAAKMAEAMMMSVRKTLPKDSALAKQIDAFAAQYTGDQAQFQNEERLAELMGILATADNYKQLSTPAKNKIIEFFKQIAKRFGLELESDFGKTDESVINLLNTLSRKTREGEVITEEDVNFLELEPYSEGAAATLNPEGTTEPEPRQSKLWENVDFVREVPVTSLQEFSNNVNGQLYIITSDLTKVGYDSDGARVDGGVGFMAIEENVDDNIGFASVDEQTARGTMGAIANQYPAGSKVGVVVMVQSPSATIGNSYGIKYFGRGLQQIQKSDPALYEQVYQSMADMITNRDGASLDISSEIEKNNTQGKLLDLLKDPSRYTLDGFVQEFLEDTSFNVRRPMLQKIIIATPTTRTNVRTPIYKTALRDAGFSIENFLSEYGDFDLIGEKNMRTDRGGFVVGGFEMIVPTQETIDSVTKETQAKGFTHPLFNGKLPSNGNVFMFDGLYPIQENFQPYVEMQTQFKKGVNDVRDARVREFAKEKGDAVYDTKFKKEGSQKYVSPEKRTYTHLTGTAKGMFKSLNQDLLEPKVPAIKSMIAQGLPVSLDQTKPIPTEGAFTQPAARQQKSMNEVIQEGRDNNFRDAAIRDYLVRVRKFKASVVDAAMAVQADLFTLVPDSFKNITGGVDVGVALWKRVDDYKKKLVAANARKTKLTPAELDAKVREYAKQQRKTYKKVTEINEEVKQFKENLLAKNARRRNPLTTAEVNQKVREFRNEKIAERDAKKSAADERVIQFKQKETTKNNKRQRQLSEQEIMDKVIEFLENQQEYKNEADRGLSTIQARMLSDLQRSVGIRPTQDMAAKIRMARLVVRQRSRGARDLDAVKREIRNFIRKALPAELYTKSEVVNMVRKVAQANQDNIENIMNEVFDFAVAKNVAALSRSVTNLLNGKYEQVVSGRKKGIKIDLATQERIKRIKKSVLSEGTAEEIGAKNEELNQKFNELQKKPDQTEADREQMVDIEIAINLNNALLMGDTDVHKVAALDEANNSLVELVELGRATLKQELKEAHDEYVRQFELVYGDVVGADINMSDPNAKDKLQEDKRKRNTEAERNRVRSRVRTWARSISDSVLGFFVSHEALDGLMDKISSLPAEMFGGRTQELITDRVDEASRNFKERRMYVESRIKEKLQEIYGKKWSKQERSNRQKKVTGIYVDKNAVEQAENAYNQDKNGTTKAALDQAVRENELVLSQNQMYYLYNQFKDPSNHGAFQKMFGPDYQRVMQEMEEALTPEVKEFADWQVNEFFPELYEHYNDVYRRIYRTNLPWNKFYAGRIYREGVEQEALDLLADNSIYNTSVGAASTKFRTNNNLQIKKVDGTDALITYLNDMEYFASYAETVRDINKLFTNDFIASAITDIHGAKTLALIKDQVQKIAAKGTRREMGDKIVDGMNTAFILSRLAISPVVMIKQLTSFFAYANDIGYGNWFKYSAKNITELKSIYQEVRDNSVYMQDRKNESIMRAIESYSEESQRSFVPQQTKDWIVNFMMWTTKFGDRTAIYMGGLANYSYYKAQALSQGKTEQEAIEIAVRKFEKDTKRTQQSGDLQDKDIFQTKNALSRAANMFLTTPKQYLRKEIQAVRNLYRKIAAWDRTAGKGTIGENMRTLLMYHVVLPVFFQWVSMGMPLMFREWREDDEEDLLRAGILGNINGLFILGELFTAVGDYFTDKPWAGESSKSVGVINTANGIIKKFKRADQTKDPEKKAQYTQEAILELVTLTGLPAPTVAKFVDNYSKLGQGDLGENILRLLNYSQYQIEGPKKKATKPAKTIEQINQEYDRELKREERARKQEQRKVEQGFGGGFDQGFGGGFEDGFK